MTDRWRCKSIPTNCLTPYSSIGASYDSWNVNTPASAGNVTRSGGPAPSSHQVGELAGRCQLTNLTVPLYKLMSAATKANAKLLLVGNQYQLAPVLARGGMFEQLCNDLPWTQQLEQVWRLRDPEEKEASLQLRNGDAPELKQALEWYRDHNRLSIGDPVAMAEDVYAAYLTDRQNRRDSIIICDTREMTDSLNMRLHEALLGDEAARAAIPNGDV